MDKGVVLLMSAALFQVNAMIAHVLWFIKHVSPPTTDPIEMGLCQSAYDRSIDSTPIEIVEL